ncbi:hypothetical protein ABUE31_21710, partial [Mesorhizobium sp. ZMM04-5]
RLGDETRSGPERRGRTELHTAVCRGQIESRRLRMTMAGTMLPKLAVAFGLAIMPIAASYR